MGLYFPRTPPPIRQELSASITWCEYMSALSAAIDPVDRRQGPIHPDSPARLRLANGLEQVHAASLGEQIRRRPEDETAHRLLGLVYLGQGQIAPAVRHLEIALSLVRGHVRRAVGLADALQRQCEAAGLRLVLLRLHMRLGNESRASSLAQEAQAVL